jgi:2-polyprenyl-6-methoxyphenol hydroxylase-like FAD-dependent oxidoreductase
VRVLERHPDFEREFRGELLQPSALVPLEKLGILPVLVERKVALPNIERRMFVGKTRQVRDALRRAGVPALVGGQSSSVRYFRSSSSSVEINRFMPSCLA